MLTRPSTLNALTSLSLLVLGCASPPTADTGTKLIPRNTGLAVQPSTATLLVPLATPAHEEAGSAAFSNGPTPPWAQCIEREYGEIGTVDLALHSAHWNLDDAKLRLEGPWDHTRRMGGAEVADVAAWAQSLAADLSLVVAADRPWEVVLAHTHHVASPTRAGHIEQSEWGEVLGYDSSVSGFLVRTVSLRMNRLNGTIRVATVDTGPQTIVRSVPRCRSYAAR